MTLDLPYPLFVFCNRNERGVLDSFMVLESGENPVMGCLPVFTSEATAWTFRNGCLPDFAGYSDLTLLQTPEVFRKVLGCCQSAFGAEFVAIDPAVPGILPKQYVLSVPAVLAAIDSP
jgi:hypothetical protein